ncbi:NAD(P)-dependent oxidoreductase [Streptomyces sp. NPDC088785]|uniref:NAD(P)-dependent oxidoreductase n=1 Tax=Streptomyces sp. NPDC088785 TaxID=3365897 RepID=UPI0037F7F356
MTTDSSILIVGAAGRAGRAVTAEARARGHRVTAVVRDPDRHAAPAADPGVRLVAGDITDAARMAELAPGHRAAVHAVSPFSGPEQGFAGLDPDFFVKAADALLGSGVPRLLVIGLFADLLDGAGRPLLEDPARLPPPIVPFARAHTAGLARLRAAPDSAADWLTLTPPAALDPALPRTGRYAFGGDHAPARDTPLSYADLAVAVLDESEHPTRHRTRVSVLGVPCGGPAAATATAPGPPAPAAPPPPAPPPSRRPPPRR